MNIVLTGFMGTGKSTVGKLLAARLGWEFVDSDAVVERTAGISVSDIFSRFGEPDFRDRETLAIRQISALDRKVVSCGGGAVLRSENMDALEKTGVVVCLEATPESIYERVRHDDIRPLLRCDDPLGRIRGLLRDRAPFYGRCSFAVQTDHASPEAIVEEIVKNVAARRPEW